MLRGHTLLWHSQNPDWLDNDELSPEQPREILHEHISTVVGRYEGKIQQWDVSNEIFDENPPESGTPTEQQLAQQAAYYGRALDACLRVRTCRSFTVWGLPNKYSWVPSAFPEQGAATTMWDDFIRKPAYDRLLDGLNTAER